MKINCAISSRRVMVLIHRRTEAGALRTDGEGLEGAGGFTVAVVRGVAAGSVAREVHATNSVAVVRRNRENTTLPVFQIYAPDALVPLLRPFPCEAGGLRTGRFSRRLTERTRLAGSFELFAMTASAPVFSTLSPSGSTKPESRI